jgi:hypothetical protein
VSTPLPEGQQEQAEHLQTKFKQPSIKQLGILPPPFLLALGNHHYLWDKSSFTEWGDKKVLYDTQTIEGIA